METDVTLTPGGHRFGFGYSLSRHCSTRVGLPTLPSSYMVVSFLMLDVTVSCEPMKLPDSYYAVLLLSFNLFNLGLFGIGLKPLVGRNFTVTGLN